jgi:hypothetical protein
MNKREVKTKHQYILKWAKKIKAINYLGGKCVDCKCCDVRVLEFHHTNESKESRLSKIMQQSWNIIKKEVDKCVILCRRCHSIKHKSSENISDKKSRNNKIILLKFINKNNCEECNWEGHSCALEFHHRDPNEKEFMLSKIRSNLSLQDLEIQIINEINKCQLLCANCHQLKHISSNFDLYKKDILNKSEDIPENLKLDHAKIRELRNTGLSYGKIASMFSTHKSAIRYIILNENQDQ